MIIIYVGNFSQKHCTEVHLSATLEDLGHTVIRLQENDYNPHTLTEALNKFEYDMFLFTRTWGKTVTKFHIDLLKTKNIPSVSYHLDLYVGLERKYLHQCKSLEDVFKTDSFWLTDFVFTPDGDPYSQEVFKQNNVNHYYIKPGVYKPECYIEKGERGTKYDIIFVGGGDRIGSPHIYGHPEWNYRNELITWLYKTYPNQFTKFGHPQATIRNEELNTLYKDSKIVIGDSVCLRNYTQSYYWSDRVYETIGRGGFLIHPYIKGLEEEFTEDENIVFYRYGNFEDLKNKIDFYLANSILREKIRDSGNKLVKDNCTYYDRMKQMISVVSSTCKVPTPLQVEPAIFNKINLGCGSEPTEGWYNVDILPLNGVDLVQDLNIYQWKIESNVAEEIKAIDVIEHLDNPMEFVKECHRILKVGGMLFMTTPHWQSKNLWIDPTHKRGFDEKSMDYFDPDTDFGKWYGYYTDQKFKVSSTRTKNDNVEFFMVKL